MGLNQSDVLAVKTFPATTASEVLILTGSSRIGIEIFPLNILRVLTASLLFAR